MKPYHNIMEEAVEALFDELKDSLGCCTCQQCRGDIVAFALNQLPPRYVVSHSGQLISKLDALRSQHLTDMRTALIKGAIVVKEHPRH